MYKGYTIYQVIYDERFQTVETLAVSTDRHVIYSKNIGITNGHTLTCTIWQLTVCQRTT